MSNDPTNVSEHDKRGFFSRFLRRKPDETQGPEPDSSAAVDTPEAVDKLEAVDKPEAVDKATPTPRDPDAVEDIERADRAPDAASEVAAEVHAEAPGAVRVPPGAESDAAAELDMVSPVASVSIVEAGWDAPAPQEQPQERPRKKEPGLFRRALSRTGQGLANLFLGKKAISDELLEDLETLLLMADVGIEATTEIINTLTERVQRKELNDSGALFSALRELLIEILKPCEHPLVPEGHTPFVMLVVGVNGVGKTTTIGKMTKRYLGEGKSVMLAAGDTFRAAAVEQLQVWGERNNVPVIAQHTGADSASVIFDAISSGQKRRVDMVIADTAGRLHNKANLMEELSKVGRVMRKLDETAPHEVLLVLDATTGQNAVRQMAQFSEAINVTGIALTKLDGTAKGGVIFALCRAFGKPVRFVGLGEGIEDLQPFSAEAFVDGLLGDLAGK